VKFSQGAGKGLELKENTKRITMGVYRKRNVKMTMKRLLILGKEDILAWIMIETLPSEF
jgi:hypothetical protein